MTAVSRQVTDTPSVGKEGTGNAGRPRACRYTTIPSKIKSRTASHGLRCIREPTIQPRMRGTHPTPPGRKRRCGRAAACATAMRRGRRRARGGSRARACALRRGDSSGDDALGGRRAGWRNGQRGRACSGGVHSQISCHVGTEPVWRLTIGELAEQNLAEGVIAQVASHSVLERGDPGSIPVRRKLRAKKDLLCDPQKGLFCGGLRQRR